MLWELQAIELSCGLSHLVQLALLIRAVRRELLLRNLRLRQYLLNALPQHALLVCPQRHCWHSWRPVQQMTAIVWGLTAGMALVDALAAAAQVGGIVRVALGVAVVRGHDLEYMQLSICVDVARRQQKQRMSRTFNEF